MAKCAKNTNPIRSEVEWWMLQSSPFWIRFLALFQVSRAFRFPALFQVSRAFLFSIWFEVLQLLLEIILLPFSRHNWRKFLIIYFTSESVKKVFIFCFQWECQSHEMLSQEMSISSIIHILDNKGGFNFNHFPAVANIAKIAKIIVAYLNTQ